MCLSLCDYRYVTDGGIFKVMEHEKSILDTKHKKRVLLLIEMATLYDEVDNSSGWKCVGKGVDYLL
ncbi:hypothetical protein ACT7C1_15160 [Bacillus paranthracis]